MTAARLLRSIRIWLGVVIIGLILSGITAFPLQHELNLLVQVSARLDLPAHAPSLNDWFVRVDAALADTNASYPFLAYGTDWLDPVRNKWFVTWGFIACAGVPVLALVAGPIRGIPFYWRLIDSGFGIFCCVLS